MASGGQSCKNKQLARIPTETLAKHRDRGFFHVMPQTFQCQINVFVILMTYFQSHIGRERKIEIKPLTIGFSQQSIYRMIHFVMVPGVRDLKKKKHASVKHQINGSL